MLIKMYYYGWQQCIQPLEQSMMGSHVLKEKMWCLEEMLHGLLMIRILLRNQVRYHLIITKSQEPTIIANLMTKSILEACHKVSHKLRLTRKLTGYKIKKRRSKRVNWSRWGFFLSMVSSAKQRILPFSIFLFSILGESVWTFVG